MNNIYFRGDNVFLYIKFYDKNNNILKDINEAKVRILHEKNEEIYEDLPWTDLNKFSDHEYYFNYKIPEDGKFGLYDVIYKGNTDNETAIKVDTFHVMQKTENYNKAIKLYGYIDDEKSKTSLSGVSIRIESLNDIYTTESYTHIDGNWESYLYPGEYVCIFEKQGFKTERINIQLNDENKEIKFNNISMKPDIIYASGNGAYKVKDKYILKNGIPLDGLNIDVYATSDLQNKVATCITDNNGEWEVFLDPDLYMLKVTGTSMNKTFDKTFIIKVEDDGTSTINDINDSKAILQEDSKLSNGLGSEKYSDIITDKSGNPIVDVQISVLDEDKKIIAETYTDIHGDFEFNLNPGIYYLKIYHPNFKDLDDIQIKVEGKKNESKEGKEKEEVKKDNE